MDYAALAAIPAQFAFAGASVAPDWIASSVGMAAVPPESGAASSALADSSQAQAQASVPAFSGLVEAGLQQLNRQLLTTQGAVQQLATGQAVSLHQVMATLEESRIAFQLVLQVRNRLLESYQEIMRMPL